jgi:hypothetical protein
VGTGKEIKQVGTGKFKTRYDPPFCSSYTNYKCGFALSAALVDQEEESYSPKLAISFVHAYAIAPLNKERIRYCHYISKRAHQIQSERERETPRREGNRLAVWLKYPNAFFFFSFSLFKILYLCLCSEKMVSGGENGGVLVDSGHTRLNELGYKQELKRDLS